MALEGREVRVEGTVHVEAGRVGASREGVLRRRREVVGEQFDADETRGALQQTRKALLRLRCVVDAGDERDAGDEGASRCLEPTEVRVDGSRIDAGPAAVGDGIGMLEVLEDEIELGDDVPIGGGGGVAARFEGEVLAVEKGDEGVEEGGLEEGFTAGEGDAAVGGTEDVRIDEDFVRKCLGGDAAAAEDAGAVGTLPAVRAGTAVDALLFLEEHFRLRGEPFGVVAPGTAEGTALEEDGRADAGPVVETELAHLEDNRRLFTVVPHGRSIAQTAGLWLNYAPEGRRPRKENGCPLNALSPHPSVVRMCAWCIFT